ncbi:PREDICTED: proprotein convertase subtilisin/kexin type 9 [Cyprinodon variegatus]|uniref:Proprotein convertase subtilisin/kexin type 9 n=1 Tax=Cyprinodon variegatus TaxID=28743 RepID=A0A3Q2FGA3_CYPVA|nr:PREDICTED: proprotein convertase subtilisin/kexin type 9 [Cyprinodon variegatus]
MRKMCPISGWIGCALCLCASLVVCAQDHTEEDDMILEMILDDGLQAEAGDAPSAQFLKCNKAAWRIPGQYVVVLHRGTHESQVQRTIRRLRARAARGGFPLEILHTYSGVLQGFLVKMSHDALNLAVKLPHVHYIEEDSSIFAQSAPWNLQRLLRPHAGISVNGTYLPPNDGGMAEVYLMDGSVQSSHREVEGRVLITDFNSVPEEDGVRVHRQASHCKGHGTHLAGVVTGSDSGVARGAGVNLVRVLNCQGKGSVSGALSGLEYIRATLLARPVDAAVVLLPFIGGFSRSLNTACRQLVAHGAVVIAAAGNYREDACLYSPASEPEVITVGAVNSADHLMSQGAGGSNFGPCVDLFAPGDDIISASSDCSTCFTSQSGTSQAAAHAAGIAAVILSSNQKASPLQVLHTMLHYSISDTINFLPLSETHRLTTPNLVAAMPSADNPTPNGELVCRSVWSERSGLSGGDTAVSRCRVGEELMGCSSYAPDGTRVGETVTESRGRMECTAFNGPAGTGVYAVARCCAISGLRCQAHASPEPGQDAQCAGPQHHLTGCTTWSTAEILSDSRPHHGGRRGCLAKGRATSHAVCCHAPTLQCHLLEATPSDADQMSCPSGWTLTDCSAVSRDAAVVGSVPQGNGCRVHNAGRVEAAGVAVCCRVAPPDPPATTPN